MDHGQSLAVQASRLAPRGRRTGVTWAGGWIWIELALGVGRSSGWLLLGPWAGGGMVDAVKSNFVCVSLEIQVSAPTSQRSPI